MLHVHITQNMCLLNKVYVPNELVFKDMIMALVTRPAKINHVSTENRRFFPSLLYHNLQTLCTNKIQSLSLLQNLMGFLLKVTEMACHIPN